MSAPRGNQFWKARSSHGRKPIFESKDQLWEACTEYFQWVEENPLNEEKLFAFQGEVTRDSVSLMRAMTISGLCLFLDIDQSTWENYRERKGFIRVTKNVEEIIYNQKFSGAAANLLNANIIARDLGLSDKKETAHSGSLGVTDLSSDELDRKIAELEQKRLQSESD